MNALFARARRYRSIAVVGMGKNTGKTVTVNSLIAKAREAGISVGLTSTGRDGEDEDVASFRPKPPVFLPPGAALATAGPCLGRGSAGLEILEATGLTNALGEIYIARVQEEGSVEVSGPERMADLQPVLARLQQLASLVLVDGAMDRRSASAPSVSEGTILATGAVIGGSTEEVIRLTLYAVEVLGLPAAGDLSLPEIEFLAGGGVGAAGTRGPIVTIPVATAVDAPPEIASYLSPQCNRFLTGGALSDPLAELLWQASWKIPSLQVVVWDATRIFVEPGRWQRLTRRVPVRVALPIDLVGITVNPFSPEGRRLPGNELVRDLKKMLPGLPVADPLA